MYSYELKQQIIKELLNGASVKNLSEKYQIHRNTLYMWKRQTYGAQKLMALLYLKKITIDDIETTYISRWQKCVFMCAYYEQNNRENGLNYLKSLLKNGTFKEPEIKKLKTILEKLKNNKKLFDITFYINLLDIHLEKNIVLYFEKKEKELNTKKEIVKLSAEKKTSSKKEAVTSFSNPQIEVKQEPAVSKKNKNNNNQKKNKIIKIRDMFSNETLEIRKEIYLKMYDSRTRNDAIKAWDIFENLINEPVTNEMAMEKVRQIFSKYFQKDYSRKRRGL